MAILEDTLLAEINELYNEPESDAHEHAGDAAKSARVNATRGAKGKAFREEMHKKKMPKPRPLPDSNPKQRRGGRRQRKIKQRLRLAAIEMRLAKKIPFGTPEKSSLGGEVYGMLGQARSIRLRESIVHTNSKVAKTLKERQFAAAGATTYGLASSLDLTSAQGIVLCNPQQPLPLGSGTHSNYFSESGTFSMLK